MRSRLAIQSASVNQRGISAVRAFSPMVAEPPPYRARTGKRSASGITWTTVPHFRHVSCRWRSAAVTVARRSRTSAVASRTSTPWLAELRDAGIVTPAVFEVKKAELLARM